MEPEKITLIFLICLFIVVIIQIRLVIAIFTIKNESIKQTKVLEAQMRLIGLKLDIDKIPIEQIDAILKYSGYTHEDYKKKQTDFLVPNEPWKSSN